MVVNSRIDWLLQCIRDGVHVRVCIGPALDPSKCKIRFTVEPDKAPLSVASKLALLHTVNAIATSISECVVVDRGHRFSPRISEKHFGLVDHPQQTVQTLHVVVHPVGHM